MKPHTHIHTDGKKRITATVREFPSEISVELQFASLDPNTPFNATMIHGDVAAQTWIFRVLFEHNPDMKKAVSMVLPDGSTIPVWTGVPGSTK
jgi:hypothetical protein